jgi:hypothetical protein
MDENVQGKGDAVLMKNRSEIRLPKVLEILLGIVVALELVAPFFAKSYGVDGPSQLNMIRQFTGRTECLGLVLVRFTFIRRLRFILVPSYAL